MTDTSTKITNNEWMVRDCKEYKDEYKNCTSIKNRFHQYFTTGESVNCTSWKNDYNNCRKWKKQKDEEAFDQIIESENIRRKERLFPHINNDVWTKRNKQPENWDAPLPDWMQERFKNTFLNYKKNKEKELLTHEQKYSCNIL